MGLAVSPLRIAVAAAAVGWPLVAGLAVVLWSKARAAAQSAKAADLDARLKGLYRTVELRETPPALAVVIDALDEHQAIQASLSAKAPSARSPVVPQG
jgi:hypothetical protein